MALPIPNLDDRDFNALMEEVIALIPRYNSRWTDFNPSDPGITILEMFAWLTEQVLFRANRVPLKNFETFLLLLGIELEPGESIESGIQRAQAFVNERQRAVTAEDYQLLTLERMNELQIGLAGRAIVLDNIDLEFIPEQFETLQDIEKPGHVSVVVIPRCEGDAAIYCEADQLPLPVPTEALLADLRLFFQDRRLIATRTHMIAPRYLPVLLEASVILKPNEEITAVASRAEQKLRAFFDPLDGGPEAVGWPAGRSVYRSEFYQMLEETEGVDHVDRVRMEVVGQGNATLDIALKPWELVNLTQVIITQTVEDD